MATFYVVRHAKAGSRGHWDQDDRLRPLSSKGVAQAEKLVTILEAFPVTGVFSSPYLRCVETVEPLARARKLEVDRTDALAEGHGLAGLMSFVGDAQLDHAVLSTHGDVVWELIDELVKRRLVKPGEGGSDKGSTWVVEASHGSFVRARYIPAP